MSEMNRSFVIILLFTTCKDSVAKSTCLFKYHAHLPFKIFAYKLQIIFEDLIWVAQGATWEYAVCIIYFAVFQKQVIGYKQL
jgi:hypothetical protein